MNLLIIIIVAFLTIGITILPFSSSLASSGGSGRASYSIEEEQHKKGKIILWEATEDNKKVDPKEQQQDELPLNYNAPDQDGSTVQEFTTDGKSAK